jgi:pantetheine-phosphate adenylyltransferase
LNRTIAIYPGSFDPLTNGHLDLIARGSKIFDELIVAVLRNPTKATPLFTVEERQQMVSESIGAWSNVRVDNFSGLLVDYVSQQKANAVLRGIRAISDYEYELQMALMNRKLSPELETVFMMPAEQYSYLSSRLVKQVFLLGGAVDRFVSPLVLERMQAKMGPQVVKKTGSE